MNYNKYIINKKKKHSYFLLIVPLIVIAIIYFVISSIDKDIISSKIFEAFKSINTTAVNNSTDLIEDTTITSAEEDENAVTTNSSISNNIAYYLIGYYENEVNTSSEKIIESTPSIKINYNGNVFFLMKILLTDEFNENKASIEGSKFSYIQIELANSKTNDKLMNSILLSIKEIFGKLTEEDIKAVKTEDFKNWVSSLPKEEEGEENYEKLINIRDEISNLKENMILEDCIGIIQSIVN